LAAAGASADTDAELQELEDELTRALFERDAATLDRLWHDDLIFIGTNGRQVTKAERLQGLTTPPQPGESNVNDDVAVRALGETAVVTVLSTWTFPGDPKPSVGRYRALHVWVRDNGRWQLLAAQVARLPN
jgi:ketosteroid isomerase-like protein